MKTTSAMTARLMVMMFLQFFIWGAWYATGGNYMKARGMTDLIYVAYMASPIGSIVAPFFLGMIADRLFAVQKVLGVMHVLSGLFVFGAPFLAEGPFASPPLFLAILLLHMLCYMPTVGLAMATAFHLLKDKQRSFHVAGQIYIDTKASVVIRAQAQGLFVLVTYGIGQGLGTLAAGWIFNAIMPASGGAASLEQWQLFWIFPLVFVLAVTALFVVGFREEVPLEKTAAVH